jgi:hypothetical protein
VGEGVSVWYQIDVEGKQGQAAQIVRARALEVRGWVMEYVQLSALPGELRRCDAAAGPVDSSWQVLNQEEELSSVCNSFPEGKYYESSMWVRVSD